MKFKFKNKNFQSFTQKYKSTMGVMTVSDKIKPVI